MTWNEFKNFVDRKLEEEERDWDTEIYLIDTPIFPREEDLQFEFTRDGLTIS